MLQNFAFTLYEVFGYLLPGGVALFALMLLYWAIFVPLVPLGVASFQLSLGAWTLVVVISYALGHAVQALGNKLLRRIEDAVVNTAADAGLNEQGRALAAELLGIPAEKIEAKWLYRTLDEYAVQNGKPGDRDMFIYREGFYRGTCIALFLLSLALLIRLAFPGSSIQFTKWLFAVSSWQLLLTAIIVAALGWLYLQRYKRFASYRVTRAVLAALVLRQSSRAE
jgi:hypothetical protein